MLFQLFMPYVKKTKMRLEMLEYENMHKYFRQIPKRSEREIRWLCKPCNKNDSRHHITVNFGSII